MAGARPQPGHGRPTPRRAPLPLHRVRPDPGRHRHTRVGRVRHAVALQGIGTSGSRYQGLDLAVGTKPYVDDIRVPGTLHAALHLTAHARADVVRIDTSPADAVPGVYRVLTAADIPGRPTVSTLRGLGILRPKDVPPIEVILVEEPQPRSPYGIKGVGEIGLVPTVGAVAAALHDLDGRWRNALPLRRPEPGSLQPGPAVLQRQRVAP